MKPFIKLRRCSSPPSEPGEPGGLCGACDLPLAALEAPSAFETLRAYRGAVFELEAHLGRFAESCAGLGRAEPCARAELSAWLRACLAESGYSDALLRVSAHWCGSDTFLAVIIRPFVSHDRSLYEQGVSLRTAVAKRAGPRSVNAQVKASDYVTGVLACLDGPPGDPSREWIFLDEGGIVSEGSVSNLFAVARAADGVKTLLTPAVRSGILRGITRDAVLLLARRGGVAVSETLLTRHDLYAAEECFLTNTSSEVMPVTSVDGRRIGPGRPGDLTRRLADEFKRYVSQQIDRIPS